MSMSAHQRNGGHDEWLTPPEIIKALGAFDLDPCAPVVRPWGTAARHYTVQDDGLALPAEGWPARFRCESCDGRERAASALEPAVIGSFLTGSMEPVPRVSYQQWNRFRPLYTLCIGGGNRSLRY